MDILWESAEAVTPRDVQDRLADRRHRLAYTTTMTILVRLWHKGMLEREAHGRTFLYWPVADRDEWAARRMREVLGESGDRNAALAQFVRSMNARETTALRRALDQRRRR